MRTKPFSHSPAAALTSLELSCCSCSALGLVDPMRPVLVWVSLCAVTAWQLLNRTAVPARVCHCSQKPGGVHAVSTFAKLIFQHTEPNKIQLDRFLLIHSMKTSHKWRINARYFPIVAFGVEPVSSSALSVLLLKA